MTTCFDEMKQEPKPTKDENAVYAGCVAKRIRKLKESHETLHSLKQDR